MTTSSQPDDDTVARAHVVAQRCRAPYLPRGRSLAELMRRTEAELAYVVGRDREVLAQPGVRLGVDAGLLHAHLSQGRAHPLMQALGPVGPDHHVVDGTLGLTHDALHVAGVTGARVLGLEVSAALFSLTEEGLPRLAANGVKGADRVTPRWGDARELLPTMRADVVLLSPMFDIPRKAPPGFDLLRLVAESSLLSPAWLDGARACAPRVVVKARLGQPIPDFAAPHQVDLKRGKHVDYWVFSGRGPT